MTMSDSTLSSDTNANASFESGELDLGEANLEELMGPDLPVRRYPRLRDAGVSGALRINTAVRVLDLSSSGAGIESGDSPGLNRPSVLAVGHGKERIELPGKTVWSRFFGSSEEAADEGTPVYRTGIRFEDLTGDLSERLHQFIANHSSAARRRGGGSARFRIDGEREAALEANYSMTIKTLSLGGFLAESEILPDLENCEVVLDLPAGPLSVPGRVVETKRVRSHGQACSLVSVAFDELEDPAKKPIAEFLEPRLGRPLETQAE